MSGSYRGILFAIGIVGLSTASLFGATYLISDTEQLQRTYEQQAEAKAKGHADRAYEAAEGRCLPLPPEAERNCISEAYDAARQGQHDEYDLQAQLVTSAWTRSMGLAAIIGMAVGIIGVGLVYVTFQQTRRAANSAENTYKAFVALERAKLVISLDNVSVDGSRPSAMLVATNIGKAACVIATVSTEWSKTSRFDEVAGYIAIPYGQLVQGSAVERIGYQTRTRHADPDDLFLRGIVSYTSPLGDHKSFFCFQFVPHDLRGTVYSVREEKGGDWPEDT